MLREVTNILWMISLSISVLSWNKKKNCGPSIFSSSPEWKGTAIGMEHFHHLQNGKKNYRARSIFISRKALKDRHLTSAALFGLSLQIQWLQEYTTKTGPSNKLLKRLWKRKDSVLTPSASLECSTSWEGGDILRAKYQHLDGPVTRIKGLLFKMCTVWVLSLENSSQGRLNTGVRDGPVVKNTAHSF